MAGTARSDLNDSHCCLEASPVGDTLVNAAVIDAAVVDADAKRLDIPLVQEMVKPILGQSLHVMEPAMEQIFLSGMEKIR